MPKEFVSTSEESILKIIKNGGVDSQKRNSGQDGGVVLILIENGELRYYNTNRCMNLDFRAVIESDPANTIQMPTKDEERNFFFIL